MSAIPATERWRCGQASEAIAWRHLENEGYRLLHRNFRCRVGEIDLVVEKNGILVFVEVRSLTSSAFQHPFATITAQKRRRLRRAAQVFLLRFGEKWHSYRFDVIAITMNTTTLEHLQNAFEMGD